MLKLKKPELTTQRNEAMRIWGVVRRKRHETGLRMLPSEGKLAFHSEVCDTLLSQHQQVDNLPLKLITSVGCLRVGDLA